MDIMFFMTDFRFNISNLKISLPDPDIVVNHFVNIFFEPLKLMFITDSGEAEISACHHADISHRGTEGTKKRSGG